MLTEVGNTINVTEPSDEIIKWCNDNLVIPNPDYAKKMRMGFWTGNTPKVIRLFDIVGDTYVIPYGVLYDIYPMIKSSMIMPTFKELEKFNYGVNIDLYNYQQLAVNCVKEYAVGILQSKAGSGKTRMGLAIIAELKMKALWLTHTLDLVDQAESTAIELGFKRGDIGDIRGGQVNIGRGITFATIQTLANCNLDLYKDCWDIVMVDEVHRVATSASGLTRYSKVLNVLRARHKFGLSATVHRADGLIKSTFALMGGVIHKVDDKEIADRVMPVRVMPIKTDFIETHLCLNPDGTLCYPKLISQITEDEDRNDLILQILRSDKRPTLVLSNRVEHLKYLKKQLGRGEVITGKTRKETRERVLKDMRSGKSKLLFATYQLAQEGLDIPRLEHLYMVTPIKDDAQVIQSIGRISRTFANKEQPTCYDFVDADSHYLMKQYKKRFRIYKNNGCEVIEK